MNVAPMLLALIWGPLSDDPLATGHEPAPTPVPCAYEQPAIKSVNANRLVNQAATTLDTGAMRITATVVAREKPRARCAPKPLVKPEFRPQSFKMCMRNVPGRGMETYSCSEDRDT